MTRSKRLLAAAAWLLAAAAPAAALDSPTGIYVGKIKCARLAGGVADKFKGDISIGVYEAKDGSVTHVARGASRHLRTVDGRLRRRQLGEAGPRQDRRGRLPAQLLEPRRRRACTSTSWSSPAARRRR